MGLHVGLGFRVVGNTRFMALYLLSAVGGGLASLASRKLIDGKGPSVGASGAIAGLLAVRPLPSL